MRRHAPAAQGQRYHQEQSIMPFPNRLAPRWPGATIAAAILALLSLVALALPALALFQDEPTTQPLRGVFTVTITRGDIPPNLAGGPALAGLWNITFSGDGTYSLSRQDVGEVVSGTFEAGEATLSFNEWSGIVGCEIAGDGGEPATYAWRQTDDTLTLTPIIDACTERLTLLTTRSLGGFEACATAPRPLSEGFGSDLVLATPVAEVTPVTGVAAQEGLSEGADAEEAIDSLLRQANGCWATGDPTRFLALHSLRVIDEISFVGPFEEFARQLRLFMATPLAFERIGPVNLIDPDHAWAYVEVRLGEDALPQRVDFAFEDGAWLFDTFFLFGPTVPTGPLAVEP
ncbi:MAG: hypothetical protein M3R07_04770 [Gemmatimonadota bacterium]|nr:hypothetical protein [Gemmatimonadota bacterium]